MVNNIVDEDVIKSIVMKDNNIATSEYKDTSYMLDDSDDDEYSDIYRNLHDISHIKIDGPDIVIYKNGVKENIVNNRLTGSSTIIEEVIRIPIFEVKEVLSKLYMNRD